MVTNVTPLATIAIVTRNRRDELRRALASAAAQTAPHELVVVDDASSDGTAEMIEADFQDVHLHRFEQVRGLLVGRNQAVRAARAPVVFFIDDDAAFSSDSVVEQTLPAFTDPDIAAVSIPHLDIVDGQVRWRLRPSSDVGREAVHSFVGCAHAVQRSAFLEVGGYRESMTYYGEESELALRLLDRGYVVVLGSSDPVHHFPSAKLRSRRAESRAHMRNSVLTALLLVPAQALPGYLLLLLAYMPFDIARGAYARERIVGLFEGYREGWRRRGERRPVSPRCFRLSERLRRHEPLPLATVRATLQSTDS